MPRRNEPSLPIRPLAEWLKRQPDLHLHATDPSLARRLTEGRQRGRITVWAADRIAVAAGEHPATIYGPAWWQDTP